MYGFSTTAVHGTGSDERDGHNALRAPVYDSATFEFGSAEEIEAAFRGTRSAHTYSRISNPTVSEFERRINLLSGGFGSIAVSSGMAAISNVIMSVCGQGDTILASPYIFGNTYSLFEHTLKKWGLTVRYIDLRDAASIERAYDPSVRGVFFETITNPQMAVFDIEGIVKASEKLGILTIADNTAATPYLFSSKKWGVDIEVLSSTKYISGGGTAVGGVIIDYGTAQWHRHPAFADDFKKFGKIAFIRKLRTEIYRNLGACISPHSAYFHTLGLETMALRIDRSCMNAHALAVRLDDQPGVSNVSYPGLESSASHVNASKYLECHHGSIVTFELTDEDACKRFMNSLKLVRRATNIHDNRTLIIHPSSTIFCEYGSEKQRELGVSERMLRVSVGIEDVDDIVGDIEQALGNLQKYQTKGRK